MEWNIAAAKQNFSDVVRQAADEPQVICNRGKAVAALVDAATFQAYQAWCAREASRSLADAFVELRRICAEEDYVLTMPPRRDRANAFAQASDELAA